MPIVIKNPRPGAIEEFMMLEIQGDLTNRDEEIKDSSGDFVGDLTFNKFGHPVRNFDHFLSLYCCFIEDLCRFSSSVITFFSELRKHSTSHSL